MRTFTVVDATISDLLLEKGPVRHKRTCLLFCEAQRFKLISAFLALIVFFAESIPCYAQQQLSGSRTIQHKVNLRYLDAFESNTPQKDYGCVTRPAQNNDSQKWIITNIGGNAYTIQQEVNLRYLDAFESNTPQKDYGCVTRPAQNNDSQKWIITNVGGNVYTIQQKVNMRYLDAFESNTPKKDYGCVTRPAQNNDSQKWIIEKAVARVASDRNPPLKDVLGLIEGLKGRNVNLRARGTKPPKHFAERYSPAADHCQGITMIRNCYVISHSAGNDTIHPNTKDGFLFVGEGQSGTFHKVPSEGSFPHCGGIQSCGDILVEATEPRYSYNMLTKKGKHHGQGSEVVFLDLSEPHKPVTLPVRIRRKARLAGAAGIAYHEKDKCHYVVVQCSGGFDLYKSNGRPLTDSKCEFTFLGSVKTSHACGGGTNLLYENTGKLYMAGFEGGEGSKSKRKRILLSEIVNPGGEATVSFVKAIDMQFKGEDSSLAPKEQQDFRWGGGIAVKSPNEIEIVAVSRCFYVPGMEYSKISLLTKRPWFEIRHKGAYVAKFYVSWKEKGQTKDWKSGKKAAGFRRTFVLPSDTTSIHLNAQAMTGLPGEWAWKDAIRKTIPPNKVYTVKGTTLKPTYSAGAQ